MSEYKNSIETLISRLYQTLVPVSFEIGKVEKHKSTQAGSRVLMNLFRPNKEF